MKYNEIEKGKSYWRVLAERKNRKRGQNAPRNVYKMLVTDKNEAKQEIEAVSVFQGKATVPQWFPVSSWGKWTKEKPEMSEP